MLKLSLPKLLKKPTRQQEASDYLPANRILSFLQRYLIQIKQQAIADCSKKRYRHISGTAFTYYLTA